MTDFTWPATIIPAGCEWQLRANTASFGSRALARAGDRWACTLSLPVMPREKAHVMRAFLARLRGQAHRVVLPVHAYVRRGALSSNARVAGAAQTGSTLAMDGVEGSLTNALRTGDFVGVAGRLYMVAADANSNSSGALTVSLTHPLSVAPADDALVQVLVPTARFILQGDVSWEHLNLGRMTIAPLNFLEDIA